MTETSRGESFHELAFHELTFRELAFQKYLFDTAVELNRRLYGENFAYQGGRSGFLQIIFNLCGCLLGLLCNRLAPARIANASTRTIALYKSGWRKGGWDEQTRERLEGAKELLKRFERNSGKKALRIIFTSHPDTIGDEALLLGRLVYFSLKVNGILPGNPKLKLLQAVDPFALDSIPPWMEGVYSGYIAQGHIAMDRQPYIRSPLQKIWLAKYHYSRAMFHILRSLKNGDTVCAALSGGVAHNSRLFYTIKEFSQRSFLSLKDRKRNRIEFEKEIISILTRQDPCACLSGTLSEKEKIAMTSFLEESKISPSQVIPELLKDLEEELKLSVPYRQRFFQVLLARTAAKGFPLFILPLHHTPDRNIVLSQPLLISKSFPMKGESLTVQPDLTESRQPTIQLMKNFIKDSFS